MVTHIFAGPIHAPLAPFPSPEWRDLCAHAATLGASASMSPSVDKPPRGRVEAAMTSSSGVNAPEQPINLCLGWVGGHRSVTADLSANEAAANEDMHNDLQMTLQMALTKHVPISAWWTPILTSFAPFESSRSQLSIAARLIKIGVHDAEIRPCFGQGRPIGPGRPGSAGLWTTLLEGNGSCSGIAVL